MRFFRKREKDEEIFRTYTPGYEIGQVIPGWRGEGTYRITQVVELSPTRLLTGGLASCWTIRGTRLS